HFEKALYVKPGNEIEKDAVFYGTFDPAFESLQKVTKLYDMVRNFCTKKPYSTEKIKLNFDCSTLLDGWDLNKEESNLGVLFEKEGLYYLGIMNKSDNKIFRDIEGSSEGGCYRKMEYKLLPGPNKMLPKVFFSKSRIDEFAPSAEVLDIYKKGTFKKGPGFSLTDCHTLIDFFKESINKHPDWVKFDFNFSETSSYSDISAFYREITEQGYKVTFKNISEEYINRLVDEGKLYLFQIYNKDFSAYSKGKPNLHTMYWKALFDEPNLKDTVYKLNGQAEVFFRHKSIDSKNVIKHSAGVPIVSKNPLLAGKENLFDYELVKDKRYTVDKFQFHVPITMNFKASEGTRINDAVCDYVANNPDVNIIGIDRGERHLLYISMVDRDGNVVKDKDGNWIQYSLNTITGAYKDANGNSVKFETPYRELLDKKEADRQASRENWETIENIKELKEGYLSQVVHHITKLMVEYNAIVVLEDLNSGFKNSRKKVEKQVYQNFEKALILKLNYLVFKDVNPEQSGGIYHAYQLADEFKGFKYLTKQTGFIFYVPAWNTSKIDPVTGFTDLLKPRYKSIADAQAFFSKFESIKYNAEKKYFEFAFDYNNFTDKAAGTRTKWVVCTHGALRYSYNRSLNNNRGGYEKIDVTANIRALLAEFDIDFSSGDLIPAIIAQNSAVFYARLMKLLQVTLAMRYSCAEDGADFIMSPVMDSNDVFFNSDEACKANLPLPHDADANGAFNIARKGIMVLNQIDNAEKYGDWTTKISNKDWLKFVQG
ncbi:MAG: type V CRISPR-associated protein Cas12a/Cpf1, partial [Clostridia bacterium]|nr:type V CRISPR-associated protein Cas12a/Cpf1 [Clostridia bacterium]